MVCISNCDKITPGMLMAALRLNIPVVFVSGGRGSSGLSIGHVSPEAAEGGAIGLVEEGDIIKIDIPNRLIHLAIDDAELARRRDAQAAKGWRPAEPRPRKVSKALRAYAAMTTSAAKGAVRVDLDREVLNLNRARGPHRPAAAAVGAGRPPRDQRGRRRVRRRSGA